MTRLFGYQNFSGRPSGRPSHIRPDFQPVNENIGDDGAIYWSDNLSKKKSESTYESPDLLVIVMGNIYRKDSLFSRYPELKDTGDQGCAAKIARLYSLDKHDGLADLTGDFILIIKDEKEKKLIIIRDKMGGRKLYFTVLEGYLIFSSHMKSLLNVPGVSREINRFALESFFKFGYVISPDTIFKSIKELEPGHWIKCGKGSCKVVQYWKLRPSTEIGLTGGSLREALYEKIEENIHARVAADERIGVYLSGGIDSNTLLAVLSRVRDPSKIQTMSIGFGEEYKDYHELNQARLAASHFGSSHHELINGPEHIDRHLCRMVWQFEQPFGNPSLISLVSLSDLAANLVDVVFVGAGADEVLGGYKRYNALTFLQLYNKIPFSRQSGRLFRSLLSRMPVGADHYSIINRIKKLSRSVQPDILKANEALLFGSYDELRDNLFLAGFLKTNRESEPSLAPFYHAAGSSDPFMQIFIADCYSDLVSEQLTRALVPLAELGIDYRAPFCDPGFMEFCLNIPNRYKAGLFRTKIVYKDAVESILPAQIMKQKKRGLSHPVGFWLQGPLYERLTSILSFDNPALIDYFDMNFLRRICGEHYSKKQNWSELLWKIIVFTMWHKIFIENAFTGMPDLSLKDLGRSGNG
jgi:asparagine synthase (glutamine-hydrolysing)